MCSGEDDGSEREKRHDVRIQSRAHVHASAALFPALTDSSDERALIQRRSQHDRVDAPIQAPNWIELRLARLFEDERLLR